MHIRRSYSIIQVIARMVVCISLLFFCSLLRSNGEINNNTLSFIVLVVSICELLMLFYNRSVYNTGLLMIFFLYTLIVHNGFVIAYFFDKRYGTFQSAFSMSFMNNLYYNKAIIIANIILAIFVLSTEVTKKDSVFGGVVCSQSSSDSGDQAANYIGLLGLVLGCVYLAYIVFSKDLWMQGYVSSLNALENSGLYRHMIVVTSLSVALLMASGTRKGIYVGLVIYGIISILHFSIGNRGEVLYAAVVCFALYSMRFNSIKLKHVVCLGTFVVILIPLVRFSRELKIDAYTFNPFTSFLDVLCEEGIEISPFTYTVECVETKFGHAFGGTYLNDFFGFIYRRFGRVSPFAIQKNIIKEIMPQQGMGYSMIAELYYNFGTVITGIIYGAFAWLIRKLDYDIFNGNISRRRKVIYSMLMVEMINLTRNDASTLPFYLVWTLFLYVGYIFLLRIGNKNGVH